VLLVKFKLTVHCLILVKLSERERKTPPLSKFAFTFSQSEK
jgi:hypothetical protein